jgi:hypothetical protein
VRSEAGIPPLLTKDLVVTLMTMAIAVHRSPIVVIIMLLRVVIMARIILIGTFEIMAMIIIMEMCIM